MANFDWDRAFNDFEGGFSMNDADVEEQRRRLLAMATGGETKKKGNLLTAAAPIAGGIAGGVGGFFVGGPVGAAVGGAAGSAAGEALRQKLDGEDLDAGKIALEGGLGAIGGPIGKVGTKIVGGVAKGALTKGGSKLIGLGDDLIASQAHLARSAAREIDVKGVMGKMADYGVANINDYENLATKVAGDDGILGKVISKAVAGAKPVEVTGLADLTQSLIATAPEITEGTGKKILSDITARTRQLLGGEQGSITGLANPTDVMAQIKALQSQADNILSQASKGIQLTPESEAIARTYRTVADELSERLFVNSGADSVLTKQLIDPKVIGELKAAGKGKQWNTLIDEVLQSKSVSDLRNIQRPFKDAAIIARETALKESGSNALGALSQVAAVTAAPFTGGASLLGLAAPTIGRAVTGDAGRAIAGSATRKAGQAVSNLPVRAATSGGSAVVSQAIGQPGARTLLGGIGEEPEVAAGIDPNDPIVQALVGNGAGAGILYPADQDPAATGGVTGEESTGGITDAQIEAMVIDDINTTGGKNLDKIKKIKDLLMPDKKGEKGLSGEQQKNRTNALSGLEAIDTMTKLIDEDGSVLFKAALPGQPGAREFDSARRNAMDVLAKLRSGAALSKNEEANYNKLMPTAFDSPETISYKTQQLRALFQRFAYGQTGSGALNNQPAEVVEQ